MMATCISDQGLREEPDDLLALSALNRRRRFRFAARLAAARGRPRDARLLRQPGGEERALGFGPVAPARHAGEPVAAPLERGRAEIVGLEGKQHGDGEARPDRQSLALRIGAERDLQSDDR